MVLLAPLVRNACDKPSISGNLLAHPSATSEQESIDVLFEAVALRVERIVSRGQPSPRGFWYDQPNDECVVLIKGTATLFFGDDEMINLAPGDYLLIPAHRKHRVERTSEDALWLAVHFK